MAQMKRERQWDMFDVAIGACELDDYLNQRYQESDLQSKFWVEKEDRVDELRPPAPGTKEQVLIPVQGPGVTPPAPPQPVSTEPLPSRPSWEAQAAEAPLPSRPPWEAPSPEPRSEVVPVQVSSPPAVPPSPVSPPPRVEAPSTAVEPPPVPIAPPPAPEIVETPEPAEPVASTPTPPNMAELLARFHQATQAYEERTKGVLEEHSGEQPEES